MQISQAPAAKNDASSNEQQQKTRFDKILEEFDKNHNGALDTGQVVFNFYDENGKLIDSFLIKPNSEWLLSNKKNEIAKNFPDFGQYSKLEKTFCNEADELCTYLKNQYRSADLAQRANIISGLRDDFGLEITTNELQEVTNLPTKTINYPAFTSLIVRKIKPKDPSKITSGDVKQRQ